MKGEKKKSFPVWLQFLSLPAADQSSQCEDAIGSEKSKGILLLPPAVISVGPVALLWYTPPPVPEYISKRHSQLRPYYSAYPTHIQTYILPVVLVCFGQERKVVIHLTLACVCVCAVSACSLGKDRTLDRRRKAKEREREREGDGRMIGWKRGWKEWVRWYALGKEGKSPRKEKKKDEKEERKRRKQNNKPGLCSCLALTPLWGSSRGKVVPPAQSFFLKDSEKESPRDSGERTQSVGRRRRVCPVRLISRSTTFCELFANFDFHPAALFFLNRADYVCASSRQWCVFVS